MVLFAVTVMLVAVLCWAGLKDLAWFLAAAAAADLFLYGHYWLALVLFGSSLLLAAWLVLRDLLGGVEENP